MAEAEGTAGPVADKAEIRRIITTKSGRRNTKRGPAKPKGPSVEERKYLLEYFPPLFLGQQTYGWQTDVLRELGLRGSRVALCAANGSGKTSRVAAPAVLWHMLRFPGSQAVVTAGVYRQVVEVLWPLLRNLSRGFPDHENLFKITENTIAYTAPGQTEASLCVGFSAADPNKAEGWHARGRDNNLLYVIDEAKGVSDQIFHAMERCQPTRLLVMSSPGACAGAFYDIFRKGDARYYTKRVTAYDCPHITKQWIDEQIAAYGEKSPIIQSMIFAQFAEDGDSALVLQPSVLQKMLASPPAKENGQLWAGCDFAAGGDENVIAIREGNDLKAVVSWREKDTMGAVGRFITEFKRYGLEAHNIFADAGGLGIPMCDALREAGWDVRRVNNGEAAWDGSKFANRGTEMWVQYARMVETGQCRIPSDDEQLHRQLTTRRLAYNSKGKLQIEPKDKMKERGLSSPDRADAVVLAFAGMGKELAGYGLSSGKRCPSFSDLDDSGVDEVMPGCFAG
jgi:hypothetical protein